MNILKYLGATHELHLDKKLNISIGKSPKLPKKLGSRDSRKAKGRLKDQ